LPAIYRVWLFKFVTSKIFYKKFMLDSILADFGLDKQQCIIYPFGSGLINHTWKIINGQKNYILQRINNQVFKQPDHIAHNIHLIAAYLKEKHPDYFFVVPIPTKGHEEILTDDKHGYFRLFPFVPDSHTIDIVHEPSQAFEAARQFGKFARLLSKLPTHKFKITLPDFHNLSLRYKQFQQSIKQGNKERISLSSNAIEFLQQHSDIVTKFEAIKKDTAFKLRVTHHDTKISNILFDEMNKGICVIDLDTVMPGYFISDVGDMMRTYLSPVSEEEKDFSKIQIREEYFKAIVKGYLLEMKDELSAAEKNNFVYAGKFIIYMQAIRFLSDYLNNDIYYGEKYSGHNLVRANNQIVLLQKLTEKEASLNEILL